MTVKFIRSVKAFVVASVASIMLASPVFSGDKETAFIVPMESLQFQQLVPGLVFAPVSGNPADGPSTFIIRMSPDYDGSMHIHTAGYTAVLISGASKHWELGESKEDAPVLKPGDSFYQAGGAPHQDANVAGTETVLFISMEGTVDMMPFK